MKSKNLLPLLAMIFLAVGSMFAQVSNPVKADVPFAFSAGKLNFPAGEYTVSSQENGCTMLIKGSESAQGLVQINAAQTFRAAKNTKLVFHRYGDRYFLYQIWVGGESRGRELPATKLERELRASNARSSAVEILARK